MGLKAEHKFQKTLVCEKAFGVTSAKVVEVQEKAKTLVVLLATTIRRSKVQQKFLKSGFEIRKTESIIKLRSGICLKFSIN